jgi:uncharacterized protein (TIGR03000 family)
MFVLLLIGCCCCKSGQQPCCWTSYAPCYPFYGCYELGEYYRGCDCYGWCYGQGGPVDYAPLVPVPKTGPERAPQPKEGPERAPKPKDEARLIVDLPADANLYIHDHAMDTVGARRSFLTPPLKAGQTYYYLLRVDITREGKVQSETKRILVQAGDTVQASFGEPATTSTGKAVAGAAR